MKKINFEAGTQISPAKVTIDDVEHNVTPAVYEGKTPLSPFVLNTLQDNIENEFQVDKTTISGKTEQEGTPSPDNIVPIKNVNVYGVNEFDGKLATGNFTNSGNIDNTNTLGKISESYIPVQPNTTYVISNASNITFNRVCSYTKDKTFISRSSNYNFSTFTTDENTYYIRFSVGIDIYPDYSNIKVEKGSTATPYTPYNYGFLDLNLQKDTDTQTVTLISKRLHEDDSVNENGFHYKKATKALGNESWYAYTNIAYDDDLAFVTWSIKVKNDADNINILCNALPAVKSGYTIHSENISKSGTGIYIRIKKSRLETEDVAGFKKWLLDNNIMLEYLLAEQEDEEFDETNQVAWNTLENLLINGYTFIDSSSDELQPTITLTEYTANEIHRENVEKFKELEKREIYSTEEQVIGKWIDGKPLYRKTLSLNTPSTTSNTEVGSFDTTFAVKNYYGYVSITASNQLVPINFYFTNEYNVATYVTNGTGKINMKVGIASYTSQPVTMTIEYTKTTD